jgi:hypothetical protein
MKSTLQGLLLESSHEEDALINPVASTMEKLQSPGQSGDAEAQLKLVAASCLSDDGWSPIAGSVASPPQEEVTIQSLDYGEKIANAVSKVGPREDLAVPHLSEEDGLATMDGDGIPTVSSSVPPKDDDDNVWVKVGSGIAVVGALVGGAFLAMNQSNENNRPSSESRQDNQSTVTIERLDDDEGEGKNKWEPAASTKT